MDLTINETLQTGAVGNRTYRGLGENIELPSYFLKPHSVCSLGSHLTDRVTKDCLLNVYWFLEFTINVLN